MTKSERLRISLDPILPPLTQCIRVYSTVYLFTQERGWELPREKVEGQCFTKPVEKTT
jgi:hypothetical protein